MEIFILQQYGYIYLRTYISWQGRCWGGIISTSTTCCGEWRKQRRRVEKGEEERFPLMQRERERERLVHRLILHSLLFTLLFLEDRSTESRPRKTKKIDHWPFFLAVGHFDLLSFLQRTGKERSSSCTNTEGAVVGLLRSRRHAPVITYRLWLRGRTSSILLLLRTFVHLA